MADGFAVTVKLRFAWLRSPYLWRHCREGHQRRQGLSISTSTAANPSLGWVLVFQIVHMLLEKKHTTKCEHDTAELQVQARFLATVLPALILAISQCQALKDTSEDFEDTLDIV